MESLDVAFDERRIHRARADRVAADAVFDVVHRELPGHGDHGPLRRAVGEAPRYPDLASNRCDVDNHPTARLLAQHLVHGGATAVEDPGDVHVQQSVPIGALRFLDRADQPQSRVVDEDVQPAEALHGRRHTGLDARQVGHVNRVKPARLAELIRNALPAGRIDIRHDHPRALLRIRSADRRADATATASHHCHPVVQPEPRHGHISSANSLQLWADPRAGSPR